jgi:virulence factor
VSAAARTRVGVVGAGNIASIAQLPTLVKRDDVALAALVSRRANPGPLMRRWGFGACYGTVEAMLAAEDLDAVFVLTPRSEHAHAVEACLRRDVDVFCEKPLAPSVDEATRLADLADARGRILMVDFNRRYAPVYVAGRETFGAAGATFCVAQKNRPGSEYRATFENAIHMVDLLRWYCGGEAVAVTAHAAGPDPWEEDGTAAMIRFDSGHIGVLMAARTAGAWNERLDAYGARRSAEVRAPESVSITVDGVTTTRELSAEKFGWATATETLGFAAAVHHFLDRLADRRPPLTSGREAVATQRLLDQILEAAGLPTREQEGRRWASHATNPVDNLRSTKTP